MPILEGVKGSEIALHSVHLCSNQGVSYWQPEFLEFCQIQVDKQIAIAQLILLMRNATASPPCTILHYLYAC